jgi:multidrug efflux pump subunit AcrA (membrane-fusion protein)
MKPIALIVAGALIIGLGAHTILEWRGTDSRAEATRAPSSLISVQVGTLKRMTVHRYVTGFGLVEAAPATARQPAAGAAIAAPVTGVITRVKVVAGQNVRRGQLLMDLNSAAMTEAYAAQEAARQRNLYAAHNTSLKALQKAEAQLALLRVTTPLSGTVVRLNVEPGTAVSASSVLAEVMNLHRLAVQTDIPQARASELAPGQPLKVLGTPPITARLGYVGSTVNKSDDAVTAWAALPPSSGLRPGQYVRIRIVTATHRNSLVAPTASVVRGIGTQGFLWTVRGDQAIRMSVKTGLREGNWIEVSGKDLKPGTAVVTVGAFGLPRRTRIRITQAAAGTSGKVASEPPQSR